MKQMLDCEDRLRSMLIRDKQDSPRKINRVIKSEILFVLKNYFDLTAEDVSLDIVVDDFGKFHITIIADARNIRIAHMFNQ